ncbi:MAG: response regulator, partial [Geminicoccales bacterium]
MDRATIKHRTSIKIVLADGDTYTSQGLRNALANEGYRDVRTVARLATLRDVMMTAMVDLLVLDVDLPDGDAIGLVKDIRRGKLGRNPFLPIILLTWASAPHVVRRAVNSGVDLILVKPLSPVQLFARIDGLAEHRRPFVVTPDYVGPDRRGQEEPDTAERYDVPNTLKEKLEGRPVDSAALADRIDAALQQINASRLAQAGMKLASAIEVVCRAVEADEITDEIEDEVTGLYRLARNIAGLGDPDIRKLCKPLLKILNTMRADID